MSTDLNVGDVVEAKTGTLANFCGDHRGAVEAFDGETVMVRMKNSGRLVPFWREQLHTIPNITGLRCCDECPGNSTCPHASVCMCGGSVDHSSWDGHSPVSMHDYYCEPNKQKSVPA